MDYKIELGDLTKKTPHRVSIEDTVAKYKFDYVIHLAAAVGGLYKNLDSNINMFSDNIKINENILCPELVSYMMSSFYIEITY